MTQPGQPAASLLRSHLTNDTRFSVPADWDARSVHILAAPSVGGEDGAGNGSAGGAAGFSVTLHRDVLQPGEDLATYVERQMAQLERVITDLDVLRQGPRVVGGVPGWEAEFRWVGEHGRLRQHQVHVLRGDRVLTWTATAPAARYVNYADQFAALIASVRFVAPSFVTVAVAE